MHLSGSAVAYGFALMLLAGAAAAAPTADEEAVDRQIGILGRPWKINRVTLRTRDYMRLRAQVKTGLPSYDQQVERAQQPDAPPSAPAAAKPAPAPETTKPVIIEAPPPPQLKPTKPNLVFD
jgi:hypothetical protein